MKNHNSRIQLFGAIVAATTLSLTCGFAAPNPERDAYFGAFLHHLQLAPNTLCSRPSSTHLQTQPNPEQPLEPPHLAP